MTSIGQYTFYNCTSLKSIAIGYSVTSIGYAAFKDCTSLKSVTIPDSVTSIGDYAFNGCTSLESVTIGNGVTSIGDYALSDCGSLESVTVPDSVTSIGNYAFYYCNALKNVNIGKGVTSIGDDAFWYCPSLISINVDADNEYYSSENGVLFNKDKTKLIQYPSSKNDAYYAVPDSVTDIRENAFFECGLLESITIPDSVTSIGDSVFFNCTSLKSAMIGKGVTSIGTSAFIGCTSLESITIPDGITSIANQTFDNCTSLESVTIPDSVTSIGNGAFRNCTSLESITIPDSVTSIGNYAFRNCTSLTSVTIPDSVTSIGDCAFGYNELDKIDGFVIYGNEGTAAEKYANDNGFVFVALDITNTENGISVIFPKDDLPDGNTVLNVEKLTAEEDEIIYDITLTLNGEAVQPAGEVTVKIPVPETMDGNKCKVYRQETDGAYTDMNAVYEDGYMAFTTDHFSVYVVKEAETDYTEYDKAVEQANAIDRSQYTAESLAALDSTLAVDVTGASQEEIDAQTEAILNAVNALEYKSADYTEYNKAVENANAIDRSQYMAESLAVLDSALAVDVSGKNITEQSVVDEQTQAILDAVNALEYKSADYTEYDKAVKQAKAIDRSQYTAESLAALDSALAVDVSGKNITEQAVVDAQTEAITDALKSLVKRIAMYRLYNPNSGEHFYTSNTGERDNLVKLGWNYEGIGWYAPSKSSTPVYRLYNKNGGEHHYTASVTERDRLVKLGWNYEGIGWNSDDAQGVPIYRQYNPNAFANNHNYTASKTENDRLVSYGWRYEGVGWYGVA